MAIEMTPAEISRWNSALNVALSPEIEERSVSESDILWLFLSINAAGVPQTEDHVARVRQQYFESLRAEGKSEERGDDE